MDFTIYKVLFLRLAFATKIRSFAFDEAFYTSRNPSSLLFGEGAISHYFKHGFFELLRATPGLVNSSPNRDWLYKDTECFAKREYLFEHSSRETLWIDQSAPVPLAPFTIDVVETSSSHRAVTTRVGETGPSSAIDVSFVIPCFAQAQFLQECLSSVARSTNRRHECIIVDDGNNDSDQLFLLGNALPAAPHQNLILITKGNEGLAAARNSGMSASNGTLIKFLDADDLLVPGSVDAQIANMQANRSQASVSGYATFHLGLGGLREYPENARKIALDPLTSALSPISVFTRWEQGLTIPIHSLLIDTSICPSFEPRLRAKEDFRFWLELSTRGVRFSTLSGVGALYRLHPQQMTSGSRAPQGAFMLEAIRDAAIAAPQVFTRKAIQQKISYVRDFYGRGAEIIWRDMGIERSAWLAEVASTLETT